MRLWEVSNGELFPNCKVWLRIVKNIGKYSLVKFANFVYNCIAYRTCLRCLLILLFFAVVVGTRFVS